MNRDTLTRYFLGECSEGEKAGIASWLESDELHRAEFTRERIRFDASLLIDDRRIVPARRRGLWLKATAVAASVAILLGLAWAWQVYSGPKVVMQAVFVPPGSRSQIMLPDGSMVWLNSNTTLRFPNMFGGKERAVDLDGEAWFEVASRASAPFVVKAGRYSIEALGTTFNVDAYSSAGEFAAALFEGSVRLYRDGDASNALYLHPGEKAELVGDSLRIFPANIGSYRLREVIIVIEDRPFDEIMTLFEKYYGLRIIVGNSRLKGIGYRGKFRMADGVEHALNVLRKDFRFSYTRTDTTNIIYIH